MKVFRKLLLGLCFLLQQISVSHAGDAPGFLSRCGQFFLGPFRQSSSSRILSSLGDDVSLLRLNDGREVVFKTKSFKTDPRIEVGAYHLDQLLKLGVVPETTYFTRRGRVGSAQRYVRSQLQLGADEKVDPRITYLDYLLANFDRRIIDLSNETEWTRGELIDRNILIESVEGVRKQRAIDFGFSKLRQGENQPESRVILERAKRHPESIFPGAEVMKRFETLSADDWDKAVGVDFTIEEIAFIIRQNRRLADIFRSKRLIP